MILTDNLPRVCASAASENRVLDIGGWRQPFNLATHVLDLGPYESRHQDHALDPEHAPRFSAETWTVRDACAAPWPFPDRHFGFSFCSHLLEDVRDPLAVCAELIRVSRAGYIETPSRAREIFAKARGFTLRSALGRMPAVGFDHHRWFSEIEGNHIRFTAKDQRLLISRRNFITRGDLGRKLTDRESGIALFWTGGFTFEEAFIRDSEELRAYRETALRRLRAAPAPSKSPRGD